MPVFSVKCCDPPPLAVNDVSYRYGEAGDHSFGGARHSIAAFRQWFERLYEVFPDLQFEIKTVIVKGWPWNTTAVVEWEDQAREPVA